MLVAGPHLTRRTYWACACFTGCGYRYRPRMLGPIRPRTNAQVASSLPSHSFSSGKSTGNRSVGSYVRPFICGIYVRQGGSRVLGINWVAGLHITRWAKLAYTRGASICDEGESTMSTGALCASCIHPVAAIGLLTGCVSSGWSPMSPIAQFKAAWTYWYPGMC